MARKSLNLDISRGDTSLYDPHTFRSLRYAVWDLARSGLTVRYTDGSLRLVREETGLPDQRIRSAASKHASAISVLSDGKNIELRQLDDLGYDVWVTADHESIVLEVDDRRLKYTEWTRILEEADHLVYSYFNIRLTNGPNGVEANRVQVSVPPGGVRT